MHSGCLWHHRFQLQGRTQPPPDPKPERPGRGDSRTPGRFLPLALPIGITGQPNGGTGGKRSGVDPARPQAQFQLVTINALQIHHPAANLQRRGQGIVTMDFENEALTRTQWFPTAE